MLREFITENFQTGLVDDIEAKSIPQDASSSSLNWLTKGDKIELGGYYSIVGNETSGEGKITGLFVGDKIDGTKQAYRTRGKKLEYYDSSSDTWLENGTDILGTDADGEDVAFTQHTSIAGFYTYMSSPNSNLYKIHNNFPSLNKEVYSSGVNFKGYIKVLNNRMYAWNTNTGLKTILSGSHKDTQDEYTSTTNEVIGTGDGSTKTFTNTLANITGTRTACNVTVTDGTETFNDNKDGTLTGSAGGTGTINYMTGAISVTFNANVANLQNVGSDYDYEDSNSTGVTNFSESSPRVANEGFFVPQSSGGEILDVSIYDQSLYCLHKSNCWYFTIDETDVIPLNEIYRENIGMENWRASVATSDGIYFIDTSDKEQPRFRLIQVNVQNEKVQPIVISYNVNLKYYNFDDGVATEWGDLIIFACRDTRTASTVNDRIFVFNKQYKSFDVLEYYCSNFAKYNGQLWAGDASTDNVMKLFDGFSANGSTVNNYWEGTLSQLGIDELKKFKRFILQGETQLNQFVKVYISYDDGAYVEIGEITGDGSYVDKAQATTVGSKIVGKYEVGGGSPLETVQKYNYIREFRVQSAKFDRAKIKFVAQDVGYFSISRTNFWDIRKYGQKTLKQYRQTL